MAYLCVSLDLRWSKWDSACSETVESNCIIGPIQSPTSLHPWIVPWEFPVVALGWTRSACFLCSTAMRNLRFQWFISWKGRVFTKDCVFEGNSPTRWFPSKFTHLIIYFQYILYFLTNSRILFDYMPCTAWGLFERPAPEEFAHVRAWSSPRDVRCG